jgi:hypothetical protein
MNARVQFGALSLLQRALIIHASQRPLRASFCQEIAFAQYLHHFQVISRIERQN